MAALFASLVISWHTYRLLVLMHETPDLSAKSADGYLRFDRYEDLAAYLLGRRAGWWALVGASGGKRWIDCARRPVFW